MSDALEKTRPEQETDDIGVEARARLMGWRPQAEYRGAAGSWKSAEEFVRAGEHDLPLVREHNRKLEARLLSMERDLKDTRDVAVHMTDMVRTTEERAFKRAKAELEARRKAAVASGDVAEFDAAEGEIAALEKEKPKPPPVPANRQEQGGNAPHPDVTAWLAENPWFISDADLKREATAMHGALLTSRPDLSLSENLRRVSAMIKSTNADKFRAAQEEEEIEENPQRNRAASVAASRSGHAAARVKPRSFEAMPTESKNAFAKYAKQLEGKGKPLTKDEWAENYWSQYGEE